MTARPRIVLHADMDAFYAAVEQRDRPELRGRPVIIGFPSERSVVCTASYEARVFGVRSAMPMAQARRLCPDGVIVEPRFSAYSAVSDEIMEIFGQHSPDVEALSLDEAFLEMTGGEALFGTPAQMGARVRAAVKAKTKLTVSVGASSSKYVAKVASDVKKPDGLTVVPPGEERAFLAPLSIRRLWGVGPKAEARLNKHGLRLIGDLQQRSEAWAKDRLGDEGVHLRALALGIDDRPVIGGRAEKSVGAELTLDVDLQGAPALLPHLRWAADKVASRMRARALVAAGVRVKLKTHDFRLHTRQVKLPRPADDAASLLACAVPLLEQLADELAAPVRLVGLATFDFGAPVQGELFVDEAQVRRSTLERTLDEVREKFGGSSIVRAEALERAPERPSEPAPPRGGRR